MEILVPPHPHGQPLLHSASLCCDQTPRLSFRPDLKAQLQQRRPLTVLRVHQLLLPHLNPRDPPPRVLRRRWAPLSPALTCEIPLYPFLTSQTLCPSCSVGWSSSGWFVWNILSGHRKLKPGRGRGGC